MDIEFILSCPECGLQTMEESTVTLAYPQEGVILRMVNVPALVCSNCGKQLVTGDVAHQISNILQQVGNHVALQHVSQDIRQLRAQVSQVQSASVELIYA
ncbi:MAG: YgiT-type zinc finger protein [Chloroflexi bacterium]|nr:YgiT-type zinc finger protein [Chloroflexota bacterium]